MNKGSSEWISVPPLISVNAKQPRPPFGEVLTSKNSFLYKDTLSGEGQGGEHRGAKGLG